MHNPAVDVMLRLAATSSRTEKEQIIMDAFLTGNHDFFTGAKLAYDSMTTFGVKKVAEILEDDGAAGDFTFADFLTLASRLARRELTGHAARDAINAAAQRCHVQTWNQFYRRVLLKDLGVGVTEKSINKVLKKLSASNPAAADLMIEVFSCQLAEDGNKDANRKHMRGRKYLDVKEDGARVITVLDKEQGIVSQCTREGLPIDNFPTITDALLPLLPHLPGSVVLDGEIVAESFQTLMTQFQKKGGLQNTGIRLAVFDIIPLPDFRRGECPITQRERHSVLVGMEEAGLLSGLTNGAVFVLEKIEVDLDTDEGRAAMNEFNKRVLAQRAQEIATLGKSTKEGIMVKDPGAPYVCKRSVNWLKIKPKISVTLEIVGAELGKSDGKNANRLGGLVCVGDEDGKRIEVTVGGGFTDEQREEFWLKREDMAGMLCEVEADGFTMAQDSDVWSLRFPQFKGLRGRVPGEKL